MSAAINLQRLQSQIESVYDVATGYDVARFLITDNDHLKQVEADGDIRYSEEKLLVSERDGELELSLFIEAQLLKRLGNANAEQAKQSGRLNDYCVALEGVSHFVYLTYKAMHNHPVTMLELELQAEVDKYVSLANSCSEQEAKAQLREHRRWLFENPVYDPGLTKSEFDRYRTANDLASQFCAHLEKRYLSRRRMGELTNCLRRFYRLSQRNKVDLIQSTR